jgi:hypothetical protein
LPLAEDRVQLRRDECRHARVALLERREIVDAEAPERLGAEDGLDHRREPDVLGRRRQGRGVRDVHEERCWQAGVAAGLERP